MLFLLKVGKTDEYDFRIKIVAIQPVSLSFSYINK